MIVRNMADISKPFQFMYTFYKIFFPDSIWPRNFFAVKNFRRWCEKLLCLKLKTGPQIIFRINKYLTNINPLHAELNPICHPLALLGAHHIFHVSGLRINLKIGFFICLEITPNLILEE